jgi:hypothetical protein
MASGWIGVDLDGTLAHFEHGASDPLVVGAPIAVMVDRVKAWIARGIEVKIVTARVDGGEVAAAMGTERPDVIEFYRNVEGVIALVQAWCVEHIGPALCTTGRSAATRVLI